MEPLIFLRVAALLPLLVAAAPQDQQERELQALLAKDQQAARLLKAGMLQEAAQLYECAVADSTRLLGENHIHTAGFLNGLGRAYQDLGQLDKARAAFERCRRIAEMTLGSAHPKVLTVVNNLATLHREAGNSDKAASLLKDCLRICEEAHGTNALLTASILNNLGELEQARGRLADALPNMERCLKIRQSLLPANHPAVALALNNLACLRCSLGDHAAGQQLLGQALKLLKETLGPDHPDVAHVQVELARSRITTADLGPEVELLLKEAIRIRRERLGKDHPLLGVALAELGRLHTQSGAHERAAQLFEEAWPIARRQGAASPEAARLFFLAAILEGDRGNYRRAERLATDAVAIFTRVLGPTHIDTLEARAHLALLYQQTDQFALAQQEYRDLLKIWRERGDTAHPSAAALLHGVGIWHEERGKIDEAIEAYTHVRKIWSRSLGENHPFVAVALRSLASAHEKKGQLEQASALYRDSLDVLATQRREQHFLQAPSLTGQGWVQHRQGHFNEARASLEQAVKLLEELAPTHPTLALPLHTLGHTQEALGKIGAAARCFDRAGRVLRRTAAYVLPGLPEAEQVQTISTQFRPWVHDALAFAVRHRHDEAIAEQSAGWVLNSKGLLEEVLSARALAARGDSIELRNRREQLDRVRAELAQQTGARRGVTEGDPTGAGLAERERELLRLLRQDGGGGEPVAWVEVAAVRKALPGDTVLVELARYNVRSADLTRVESTRYAAWLIPPTGIGSIRIVDLGAANAIDRAARRYLKVATESNLRLREEGAQAAEAPLTQTSTALASLVLKPLLPHLGKYKRWAISPDAALALIPWVALPLSPQKLVLEGHRVSYLHSGRELCLPRPSPSTRAGHLFLQPDFDCVLYGDNTAPPTTTFDPVSLPSGADTLVEQVKGYTRVAPIVHLRADAKEGVLKAAHQPRVLMLFTHGRWLGGAAVGSRNPLADCELALAGANHTPTPATQEDGRLTGMEVASLDLRGTELVVLCACESGVGCWQGWEGLASLRQAFLLAGARNVVSTLWQVPSQDSATLIEDFWKRLAGGSNPADALQDAQLLVLERQRRSDGVCSYIWAGFTLTGTSCGCPTKGR